MSVGASLRGMRHAPVSHLPQAFWVPALPKVDFPSPSQGTTTDGQVGRGLGEGEELCASKR